jgi:hypothetical protein
MATEALLIPKPGAENFKDSMVAITAYAEGVLYFLD